MLRLLCVLLLLSTQAFAEVKIHGSNFSGVSKGTSGSDAIFLGGKGQAIGCGGNDFLSSGNVPLASASLYGDEGPPDAQGNRPCAGSSGNDVLNGGPGAILWGGKGQDTYISHGSLYTVEMRIDLFDPISKDLVMLGTRRDLTDISVVDATWGAFRTVDWQIEGVLHSITLLSDNAGFREGSAQRVWVRIINGPTVVRIRYPLGGQQAALEAFAKEGVFWTAEGNRRAVRWLSGSE